MVVNDPRPLGGWQNASIPIYGLRVYGVNAVCSLIAQPGQGLACNMFVPTMTGGFRRVMEFEKKKKKENNGQERLEEG